MALAIRRNIVLLTKSPRNVKRFYSPRLTPDDEETSVEETMESITYRAGYTMDEIDEVSQKGGPTLKNHVDSLFRKEPPEHERSGRMLFRYLPCQGFVRTDKTDLDLDFDYDKSDDYDIDDVGKGGGQ